MTGGNPSTPSRQYRRDSAQGKKYFCLSLSKAYRQKRTLPGFSLIEMLVAVTLFSIMVIVISQTFMSFNQLHRKIANRAIVSQDLRFVMEMLVRASRDHAISYAFAPLPRDSQLVLDIGGGQTMIFKKSVIGDSDCGDSPQVSCLLLSTDNGVTWAPVSAKRVNVERFDVYIQPLLSPFVLVGTSYPNSVQPFVTFNIKETYQADRAIDNASIEAQTTVSSRMYLR